MQPPDITRVFKGAKNEFEVEIVFAQQANQWIDFVKRRRKESLDPFIFSLYILDKNKHI
jgi:hypothetical protein